MFIIFIIILYLSNKCAIYVNNIVHIVNIIVIYFTFVGQVLLCLLYLLLYYYYLIFVQQMRNIY